MIYKLWRWLVFHIGHLRWIGFKYFPFIATWDVYENQTDQYEVHEAMKYLIPGDVIVERRDGFACNLGIGGALIHAALYLGKDECLEALSDYQGGVVRRHVAATLTADKVMILRPLGISKLDIENAITIGKNLVGFKYDIYFDFNTRREKEIIELDYEAAKAGRVKFCCTEIPYYCYMDCIDKLELYREENDSLLIRFLSFLGITIGNRILRADEYVVSNFEIIWMSKMCTYEWFKGKGCSEGLLSKVKAFLEKK